MILKESSLRVSLVDLSPLVGLRGCWLSPAEHPSPYCPPTGTWHFHWPSQIDGSRHAHPTLRASHTRAAPLLTDGKESPCTSSFLPSFSLFSCLVNTFCFFLFIYLVAGTWAQTNKHSFLLSPILLFKHDPQTKLNYELYLSCPGTLPCSGV